MFARSLGRSIAEAREMQSVRLFEDFGAFNPGLRLPTVAYDRGYETVLKTQYPTVSP